MKEQPMPTEEQPMPTEELTAILHFLEQAENLKSTLRTSYTATGRHESSAEHTWRLCLMLVVFDADLAGMDRLRLLHMAVIHDLAEAICGDIPAVAQHADDCKSDTEATAMARLTAGLPEARRAALLSLWEDYESGASPEARFVKGLDKLETILQHNQGRNPATFDYAFNLRYGQEYMAGHPLLAAIRPLLDAATRERAAATPSSEGSV